MLMLSTLPRRLFSVALIHALCAATTTNNYRTASSLPPTCPATTINYITHTPLTTGQSPSTSLDSVSTSSLTSSCTSIATTPITTTSSALDSVLASPSPIASNTALAQHNVTISETIINTHVASSTDTPTTSPLSSLPSLASSSIASTASIVAEVESEIDSSLDSAKFLSFEDWKKQNLAQAGQSVENLAARSNNAQTQERRRPENLNGLESLGEEAEIDLDFGFGNGPSATTGSATGKIPKDDATATASDSQASPAALRNKDAGKTCKERFNYASFDCAANIIKTNPRCKSSNSILVENKDSYMLNECSMTNKFLIVELCDDILVDTIVLANFEFFSSMFRTFKISVSDRFPVKAEKWKDLGTFEARNSRDIQAFLIENPLIWARYLRVEFLTHYGSEYYCPISLLRVHGTTMMEEFRHQEQAARGELDDEEEEENVADTSSKYTAILAMSTDTPVLSAKDTNTELFESDHKNDEVSQASSSSKSTSSIVKPASPASSAKGPANTTVASGTSSTSSKLNDTTTAIEAVTTTATIYYKTTPTSEMLEEAQNVSKSINTTSSVYSTTVLITSDVVTHRNTSSTSTTTNTPLTMQGVSPVSNTTSIAAKSSSNSSSTAVPSSSNPSSSTPLSVSPIASTPLSSASSTSSSTSSNPPTSTPPATQESFFKSIHKRLTSLESNATLSLQYIESQSSLLRDAFASASKRQLARTTTFLDTLNTTVSTELLRFSAELSQIWQSTVLELANQREEGRRERELLAEHVKMLAEEVVSQKRIVAVQTGLMLLCLGAIVFGQLGGGRMMGGSAYSPTGYGKGSGRSPGSASRNGYSAGRLESPGGVGGESGGSASAVSSRPRWRWDSPFRSSVGPALSVRPRKPLPMQRRVVSDGAVVNQRMHMHSLDEEDDAEVNVISPASPASVAEGTEGTEGVSDVDVDGEVNEPPIQIGGRSEESVGVDLNATPSLVLSDADGMIADFPEENILVQVRSAPTTPRA